MPIYQDKKTARLYMQFNYHGETYKRRFPANTTKSEAKAFEVKFKHKLFFDNSDHHEDISFETFLVERYLPLLEAKLSPSAFKAAISIIKTIVPFLQGKPLRTIKAFDIDPWQRQRASTRTMHGAERKPATVCREMSYISGIFRYALKNDLIDYNPCSRVDRPQFDNVQDRVLEMKDEERFFAAFDTQQGDWSKDICKIVLNTGLRQKDVLHLSIFNINWDDKKIVLIQGKTQRKVRIPMNSVVEEIIKKRWNIHESLLFPSPVTGGVATQTKTAIKHACDRAGIPRLTISDLRRTFGTRLHDKGYDDTTVAQLLGHRDTRSVHRYKRGKQIHKEAVESLAHPQKSAKSLPLPFERLRKKA